MFQDQNTFETIQPNPSYDMLLMSSQRSVNKVMEAFLRLAFPLLKVDTADDDDDDVAVGDNNKQVGIYLKVPLPLGTAERSGGSRISV